MQAGLAKHASVVAWSCVVAACARFRARVAYLSKGIQEFVRFLLRIFLINIAGHDSVHQEDIDCRVHSCRTFFKVFIPFERAASDLPSEDLVCVVWFALV